jgi:hypothetical protein
MQLYILIQNLSIYIVSLQESLKENPSIYVRNLFNWHDLNKLWVNEKLILKKPLVFSIKKTIDFSIFNS